MARKVLTGLTVVATIVASHNYTAFRLTGNLALGLFAGIATAAAILCAVTVVHDMGRNESNQRKQAALPS